MRDRDLAPLAAPSEPAEKFVDEMVKARAERLARLPTDPPTRRRTGNGFEGGERSWQALPRLKRGLGACQRDVSEPTEPAKAICERCLVFEECSGFAAERRCLVCGRLPLKLFGNAA